MGAAPSFGEWAAFLDAASRFLFANWLFQATGVLLAGLLVSRLPRLRPSFRHGVLAAALFLAVAAPLSHLAPLPVRVKLPASLAPTLVSASERAAVPGRRNGPEGTRERRKAPARTAPGPMAPSSIRTRASGPGL